MAGVTSTSGSRRARRRRRIATTVLPSALTVHGGLVVRGASDPHKLFAFRPFNESDTWRADIVRVLADGTRRPVDDGTWTYDWDELVGEPKVQRLDRQRHASAGAPASVDFLQRALDWALDNIPDDHDTVAFEATVTVFRNTRGPTVVVLHSTRERSL